jgi:anti-sigma factor RsiW
MPRSKSPTSPTIRPAPVTSHSERGYLALSWSDEEMTYWAVSDAAADELESFVKLFRSIAAGV